MVQTVRADHLHRGIFEGILFFLFCRQYFLFISFKTTLNFLYVFSRRQGFGPDATIQQHTAHGGIIVDMLAFYANLTLKVFLLNVYRSHFRRKVFCFYG